MDLVVLRINDDLSNWNLPENYKPFIESIYGVFLFDRKVATYCCEITPSYFLEFLYRDIVFSEDFEDESLRDEIQQWITEATVEEESHYRHCSQVDRMIEAAREEKWFIHEEKEEFDSGFYSSEEEAYREVFEALREHFCCNHYV